MAGQVEFSSTVCFCCLLLRGLNHREALGHLPPCPKVGSPSCKFLGNGKNLLAGQERAQAALEMVRPATNHLERRWAKNFHPLKGWDCHRSPSPFLLPGWLSSSDSHKGRTVELKPWKQTGRQGSNPGSATHQLGDLGQGLSTPL